MASKNLIAPMHFQTHLFDNALKQILNRNSDRFCVALAD